MQDGTPPAKFDTNNKLIKRFVDEAPQISPPCQLQRRLPAKRVTKTLSLKNTVRTPDDKVGKSSLDYKNGGQTTSKEKYIKKAIQEKCISKATCKSIRECTF